MIISLKFSLSKDFSDPQTFWSCSSLSRYSPLSPQPKTQNKNEKEKSTSLRPPCCNALKCTCVSHCASICVCVARVNQPLDFKNSQTLTKTCLLLAHRILHTSCSGTNEWIKTVTGNNFLDSVVCYDGTPLARLFVAILFLLLNKTSNVMLYMSEKELVLTNISQR